MKIENSGFKKGYNPIINFKELPWDNPKNPKMNFGILIMDAKEIWNLHEAMEKVVILLKGAVILEWTSASQKKSEEKSIARSSIFDENPWCLHVPQDCYIEIEAESETAELAIISTPNDTIFPDKLYSPLDCISEERGKGTMKETSTRIVRTIFDDTNSPKSNLVVGEVINYPGKWSSYPPHHHEQPEFYHYRFLPEQGFGFSMLGKDAVQVHHGDTVLIFNEDHAQTSAPGYAMYYIWAIRHLDGKRYGPSTNTPEFTLEHTWVMKPESEKIIYPIEKKNKI